MNFPTHAEMHDAHLQWQAEHGAWMEDIDRWQTESRSTVDELAHLESLLDAHCNSLNERRDEVIGQHFSQLKEHACA